MSKSAPRCAPDGEWFSSGTTVLDVLHARVWQECQNFLDREVAHRRRYSDWLDRAVRGDQELLQRIGS